MTDPASAIRHEVDVLVQLQIKTLGTRSSLTSLELTEYHARSTTLRTLFAKLDAARPVPPYRVYSRN
jgi:hypothetical protein